ncbi:hypothetical protein MMC30_001235 [Trapelia coarctata]|nr:hypothetical protein [Trapelia coarctata]
MQSCIDDPLTSGASYSSDLEMYDTDDELERLPLPAVSGEDSLDASDWTSNAPTPSTTYGVSQSSVENGAPGVSSQPRVERAKAKSPKTAPKRLDMKLYMPLGSVTFVPIPDTKLPLRWKESVKPADCMPDDHPLFLPFSQLLSTAWIRIFTGKNRGLGTLATTRVYVVPDDVGLSKLPRSLRKHRAALRTVIDSLDTTEVAWLRCTGLNSPKVVHRSESEVEDSLFYIFNTLKSPKPDSSKIEDAYAKEAVECLIQGQPATYGLKTDLYPYQWRSAATMIQREVSPAHMLDPRLETLTGPTGREFYLDREACMLYSERSEYEEARGGILAETMGYGKTLICLTTILQTKGHRPHVPPQYSENLHPVRPRVGSLMDMAAATVVRAQVPWKSYFEQLSRDGNDFGNCVKRLEANPVSYAISGDPTKKSARTGGIAAPAEVVRLCSTTLIVVPPNLVAQWRYQINHHLEADCLSVLVMDDLHEQMPAASRLQTYDIILISKSRFEKEHALEGASIHNAMRQDPCSCGSVICCCPYRSPLRELHFLRLVVDEGHNFVSSGALTNAASLLSRLHVERKWIVSGTPSSGLIGVEVDVAASETLGTELNSDGNVNQETLAARRKESSLAQERKDLEKIGHVVVDFLRLKPWANVKGDKDSVSWRKYAMPSPTGIRKGVSLKSTLEGLVVRHRIEDIEADLQLPPLYNQVVHIEPAYYDKLSINLFILTLTANAVTSERADQDYMFHPRNRKQLDQLVRNLRQSGFYWTGFGPHEVAETIRLSSEYFNNPEKTIVLDDRRNMEKAIRLGQTCLNSSAWRAICQFSEMGLFVEDFPEEASHGWTLDPQVALKPLLLGTTQLQLAQKYIQKNIYASNPAAGLFAAGVAAMDKARNEGQERPASNPSDDATLASYKARSKSKRVVPDSTIVSIPAKHNKNITARAVGFTNASATSPLKSLPQQPSGLKSAMKSSSKLHPLQTAILPPDSPLIRTRLIGTASAKLSYLLDQVARLHQEEKIIIFYEGDHIAWYIAQSLEVIGVQHLIYAKGTSLALRNAYMETFNTSEAFRVLLMDLRQAAHGLHVASASRVFFVNPVWQPNVEAQAIKRAHRIGQHRPVYVETLVLKNTIEEQLLERRKSMTAQEHLKAAKSPLDDSAMNEMIRNAAFVPIRDWEIEDTRKQMAPLKYPQPVFQRNVATGTTEVTKPTTEQFMSSTINQQAQGPKRKAAFQIDLDEPSGTSELTSNPKKVARITFQTP